MNMFTHDLGKLIDNLRMFNITGKEEYREDILKYGYVAFYIDNSLNKRVRRILKSSGFVIHEDGSISTKKGIVHTLP